MRIDEICRLRQLRRSYARWQFDDAVFDLIVVSHQNGETLGRLQPDELHMLQHGIIFGRQYEPCAA